MKLILLLAIFSQNIGAYTHDCTKWFSKHHFRDSPYCEENCSLVALHDGEIYCSAICYYYCEGKKVPVSTEHKDEYPSKLKKLILYPGLTDAERDLIQENPTEALKVFRQKNIAEELTQKQFPESLADDEGDAYRHVIWAGLLVKELGPQRAKIYLDAHEANMDQPKESREMDLANNKTAIELAKKLGSDKKLNLESLQTEALKMLRNHKLVVTKSQGNIPKKDAK